MATKNNVVDGSTSVRVRRGRVESVDLYEIKDNELDALEKGTPADLDLNFSIFLLSIAASSIASLSTATFENKTVEIIFLLVAIVGVLIGLYLMISWWRKRSEVKALCTRIRQRIPPDALSDPAIDEEDDGGVKGAALQEVMPAPLG